MKEESPVKQPITRLAASVLLAAALCVSPLATPALAAEVAPTPTAAATASSEPEPTQAPVIVAQPRTSDTTTGEEPNYDNPNPPTATPTAAPTEAPLPSEEPAPEATPEPTPYSGQGVYVTAATVTDTAGGEIPEVKWNDRVNVVLKVIDHSSAQFDIDPSQISARVNSSIFTFTGNAEIGQLTEAEDSYGPYYSYTLLFRDVIYNGGGNTFPVNLSYLDSTLPMQQFSVTIGQCVDKDPNDPTKARAPSIIVRQASYGTETITAGSNFTLSLQLYATNGTEGVSDVVASLNLPEGVSTTGGTLSTYVGSMEPRATRDVTFEMQSTAGFTAGVANITVNIVGAGATSGSAVNGSTVISVPISQPDRFELGQLQLNDSIYLGDTQTVTLNFVNKGRDVVSNIEASISGENLGAELTQQYIGNLNAGSENSVDFDLVPSATGPVSGTITLNYEAQDGTLKSVSKDFSFNVMEMPAIDDTMMTDPGMMEPTQPGFPVWGIVLIVVAVIVAVVVVVLVIRRKRKKAAALASLEEEDEDL